MKQLLMILVLCVLSVSTVGAQDEITLAYGDSYQGEFTSDNPSLIVGFEGAAGDVIYVLALDNIVPVEFRLMSPSGGQLAQSDNAMIRNFELGTDGRYSVEFTRPEWSEENGEFWFHIDRFENESLTVTDDGWTLMIEDELG